MQSLLFKSRSAASFRALLTYRLCVVLCYQLTAVVVGWQVYGLTQSKLALGLIGLAEVVPYFCCALLAGYAVDHFNKKRLGLIAGVLLLLTTALLLLTSIDGLGIYTTFGLTPIYVAIAISGVARAFFGPIYNTLMVQLVERAHYAKAVSIGATVFQTAQILGPAIGGGLLALGNVTLAYGVAMFFVVVGVFSLLSIRAQHATVQTDVEHSLRSVWLGIGQGLRFVFSNQILLGAMALDMFAVLFGGAMAMLPAFVSDVLHAGPQALGLLRSAPAFGAFFMGLYLSRKPIARNAGRILLLSVAGFGLCMMAFALSHYLWLSMAILGLSGAFDSISVVLRSTIMQLSTPDAMRGRVSSISGIFIGSSNELGAFESGLTASWFGLVPSVLLGGAMTLIVVAVTAKVSPKLRRLHLNDLL